MSQVVACSALAHALVAVVRGASADAGQPATGCHRSGSRSRVSTAPLGGSGSAGRCCAFEASSLRQALLKVCVPSSNGLVTTRSVTRMNRSAPVASSLVMMLRRRLRGALPCPVTEPKEILMSWSRVSPPCWPASPRPQGGHWVYEPKRDGFRGLLVRRGARAPAVWRRGASGGERHFAWPLS